MFDYLSYFKIYHKFCYDFIKWMLFTEVVTASIKKT
jgi:hypothetical protein